MNQLSRSPQGVKFIDLELQDKAAAAVVLPPEAAKTQPEEGKLLQSNKKTIEYHTR